MKTFNYTLTIPEGIHARPAGLLVSHLRNYPCAVRVKKGDKTADCKRLVSLMGLGAKKGDTLFFEVEGEGEESGAQTLAAFLEEHL